VRGIAGGFEPRSQSKLTAQQQQRFAAELRDLQRAPPGPGMRFRDGGGDVNRIEQPAIQGIMTGRQNSKVHVTAVDVTLQVRGSGFQEVDLYARMSALIAWDKWRKKILYHLGGRTNA
jgi:hypothetical protein